MQRVAKAVGSTPAALRGKSSVPLLLRQSSRVEGSPEQLEFQQEGERAASQG
jgi:hypothetical protein